MGLAEKTPRKSQNLENVTSFLPVILAGYEARRARQLALSLWELSALQSLLLNAILGRKNQQQEYGEKKQMNAAL
jgi:hypothetical protein